AQALAQGLEGGDLLEFDWTRRQFGGGRGGARTTMAESEYRVSRVDAGSLGSFDLMSRLEGQEVKTEVPRTAEAGLYTWGDKGRLCALVRAQLVRAQHADAAPGAVDNDMSISGM
ncbi:hypothetical protein POSPLADRAFT_1161403, partial [Postia placenta MAD-698-R-SB12]